MGHRPKPLHEGECAGRLVLVTCQITLTCDCDPDLISSRDYQASASGRPTLHLCSLRETTTTTTRGLSPEFLGPDTTHLAERSQWALGRLRERKWRRDTLGLWDTFSLDTPVDHGDGEGKGELYNVVPRPHQHSPDVPGRNGHWLCAIIQWLQILGRPGNSHATLAAANGKL